MDIKKILIDVGTNYVTNILSKYDIVHCIEPNPEICKYLRENTNYTIHELAIDNFIGKHSFGISKIMEGHQKMGCSSLYEFTDKENSWTRVRDDFQFTKKIEVDVITMKKFIEDNNIEYVTYFHCDAQGSDLNVLKSFGEYINIVEAGRIEVANKLELYKDVDNTFESTVKFLDSNNFEITNWDFINKVKESKFEIDIEFKRKVV